MAVAFATAPIVGQNFGAGKFERVRETFVFASLTGAAIMLLLSLACQWQAPLLIRAFTAVPAAQTVGAQYLQICSWNFVATGLVFTCSGVFQGLGNTLPVVLSSASRILSFIAPSLWLSAQPGFQLTELWYVSVVSVALQALFSLWLVRREFRLRLRAHAAAAGREAGFGVAPSAR